MSTAALPSIPSAIHPLNKGNLRLKSLSIRELDPSIALSTSVDLTLTNERLSFTTSKADGTSVPMFSAIGDVFEVPSLSVHAITSHNLSTADVLTVRLLSVHAMTSQLSVGGDSFLPVLSTQFAHMGTLHLAEEDSLSVAGHAVFQGGDLQVQGAGAFESTRHLSVGNRATVQDELSVGAAATVGAGLSVGDALTVASGLSTGSSAAIGANADVAGDLTVLGADTVLGTNLSVQGEVTIRGRVVADSSLSTHGNATVASKLSVGNAVRLSHVLNVLSVSTFHGSVSVHGPMDLSGDLSLGGDLYADADLSLSGLATLGVLSAGVTTCHGLKVRTNLSVAGDLVVEGNTITLNTHQVDIEDPIIEIGTGGEPLAGIKIIKDEVDSNDQSGIFREAPGDDGTPAFFALYETFNNTDSTNVLKEVGNLRAAQLSTSAGAFLGGPLSAGGQVYVEGGVVVEGDISVQGSAQVESDVSVAGEVNVHGHVQTDGAVSVSADITSGGRLSVASAGDFGGVLQVDGQLSVTQNATLSNDLSVGRDLQVDADSRLTGTLSVGSFALVDGSLSVAGAAAVGGAVSVAGPVTIDQSLSVSDVATLTSSGGSNIFTVDSAFVSTIILTADNVDVVHVMEFDEAPISVTLRQDGKTNIVYTELGTSTGPPIALNGATGKYEVRLQYIAGTALPVMVPSTYEVLLARPYVSKAAFRIRNVLTDTFVHDTAAQPSVDLFTPESGHAIPTISVSGDVVVGAALSVGHDLQCAGNTLFSNASKRVGILGKLSVSSDVNLNSRLVVGGGVDSFLSVGSEIAARSSLSLGGDAVLGGLVSVGQDAYFEESVLIKEGLSVNGALEVVSTSVLNASLSVGGAVVVENDVSVSANQVVGVDLSVGAVTTTNMLSVNKADADEVSVGGLFVQTTLLNAGTSDLEAAVQAGATLSVAGETTLRGSLSAGSDAFFEEDARVKENLSVGATVRADGAVHFGSTLDVAGVSRFEDDLSVQGNAVASGSLSVGSAAEVSGNAAIRGLATVNNRLSVGRALTVARTLSVGDTITGSRDLSVGGLVLDRNRTHNRYYLNGSPTNAGLQLKATSAGLDFTFSLTDGRLVTVTSFEELGEFVVRSPPVQVEWIEVAASVTDANILEVSDLNDSLTLYQLDVPGAVLAGTTALSVGHNMIVGKAGEQTSLSVGSILDVTGRSQIGNTLSVSGDTTLAAQLSVGADADIAASGRVGSSLSVGDLVVVGATLSVHSDATVRGAVSVAQELDVASDARLGSSLSVGADVDVGANGRVYGSLSVNGLVTVDDSLSASGDLALVGDAAVGSSVSVAGDVTAGGYLSLASFAAVGAHLHVASQVSIGSDISVVGKAELNSSLSVNGPAFVGDSLEVEADLSVGGDSEFAGLVSVGGFVSMDGSLSVGGVAVMDKSLSVASMLATPSLGDNVFTFNQPIIPEVGAVHLRIELAYPHILKIITNIGDVGLTAATVTANGTYVSTFSNPAGITDSVGQISGFKLLEEDNPNSQHLRFMTEHEVLNVEYEVGNGDVSMVHNNVDTPGLVGGRRAPTLSVGGRIILLEDLSVGFNTTIEGSLSVSRAMVSDSLSVSTMHAVDATTKTLSTQSAFLEEASFGSVSVGSLFGDSAYIKDFLSVAGPVRFEDDNILFAGQNLTLEQNLSVGGDAQMNLISVSVMHANLLSVNQSFTSELSVHTLFVQQVTTSDPDDKFDFQDDATFQGDLTIEGKLFVKDILYTGPGGAFTIENIAGLTVEGNISTASLFLDITNPPLSSADTGSAGSFTVDQQYLYVCVSENTWRRVTMSAF